MFDFLMGYALGSSGQDDRRPRRRGPPRVVHVRKREAEKPLKPLDIIKGIVLLGIGVVVATLFVASLNVTGPLRAGVVAIPGIVGVAILVRFLDIV